MSSKILEITDNTELYTSSSVQNHISIASWKELILFVDKEETDMTISLAGNSRLTVIWWYMPLKKIRLFVTHIWEKSVSDIRILWMFHDSSNLIDIKTYMSADQSEAQIEVLNILSDNAEAKCNCLIDATKWTKRNIAKINEENIMIWEKAKISWVPALLASTNDVKASHNASIERIKEEDIFYLESRWIDKTKAKSIMLEAKINKLFAQTSEKDFLDAELILKRIK